MKVYWPRHDQCVGRSGKRRRETHAGTEGDGKQERDRADTNLLRTLQSYGSQQYGRRCVADEHGHQGGREIDSGHECQRAVTAQSVDKAVGYELGSSRFSKANDMGSMAAISTMLSQLMVL